MAKKVITQKARISVVKKRWYILQAPQLFGNIPFGETPAAEPETLTGRCVRTSLSNIIKGSKKQEVELCFKVTEVKGSECHTELVSMEILPQHIRRIVKRAKKRVDDSFVVTTKENIHVRLKPLLLVRENVQHSLLTALRKRMIDYFFTVAKEMEFNDLVNKVISGEIQRDLRMNLKKVYPVAAVEMRMLVRE